MSLKKINNKFSIDIKNHFVLASFHPVTNPSSNNDNDVGIFLDSLLEVKDMYYVFTASNIDSGGQEINKKIKKWVSINSQISCYVESFGKDAYFSLLSKADLMIGNSSSGIIESAIFKLPAINILPRQEGRSHNSNIINTLNIKNKIIKSIYLARETRFKKLCNKTNNIFDIKKRGSVSKHVVKSIIKKLDNINA